MSITETVKAALRPAQETLFDLLRGITREQERTNELLAALLTFQIHAPTATTAQRAAVTDMLDSTRRD